MDALTVVLIIATLAVGVTVGWFLSSTRSVAELARMQAELAAAKEDRDRQYDLHRDAVEFARSERQAEAERSQQQNAVLTALAPVRDSLLHMQRKVAELEQERHTQFGSLAEQLRRAQESDEALRSTTEVLAGALRSTTTRGVWGEAQLRRVVEAAGLLRHVDFDLQSTISSDRGQGRPDMIIRLAGGMSIAVDAKAPLDAYLEAMALPADDGHESLRRACMRKHSKAVRSHIDALSKKMYWSGLAVSPEFVICFLPGESLLSAAMDEDPALLDYAFGKRVALASPVSLWAVLKTVAHTWTQHEASTEARALLALGTQLYERLSVVAGHADDLRRAVERTVDSYNKFAGSLENRVLVTARRFPGIDSAALDSVPAPVTSPLRRFTAAEFIGDGSSLVAPLRADLGDVRNRTRADDAGLIKTAYDTEGD